MDRHDAFITCADPTLSKFFDSSLSCLLSSISSLPSLTSSPTMLPELMLYTFYSTLTLKIGENNSCASWVSETGIIMPLSEPAVHLRWTSGFLLFFSLFFPPLFFWEISKWSVLSWRDDGKEKKRAKVLIYIFHVNQRLQETHSCFCSCSCFCHITPAFHPPRAAKHF